MVRSKRSIYFSILLAFLLIGNIILLVLAFQFFPAYGGFSRQVIYIKPDNDSSGYFIIIDDLAEKSENFDIEWVLHTRGKIETASDDQSLTTTVQSYISEDKISLQVSFLEEIDEISEHEGYFLPSHYSEEYAYNDLNAPYIKTKYQGSNNPIMGTVLYPKNDSDSTQSFADIFLREDGIKKIGDNDFLYYSDTEMTLETENPDLKFNGQLFFLRQNTSFTEMLEYYFLQGANFLKYEGNQFFSSQNRVSNVLVNYQNSSQISGSIKPMVSTDIEIFTPFNASMLKIDGVNSSFSQSDSIVSFKVENDCSFVISKSNKYKSMEYDFLRDDASVKVKPKERIWKMSEDDLKDLSHPFLLYNSSALISLRKKIADADKEWSEWYTSYLSDVDEIEDAENYEKESRYIYLYKLALKYIIEGGESYLNQIKDFLDEISVIDHYSQDLRRAYSVLAFGNVLDMIYENLSQDEQKHYEKELQKQAYPLMLMDLYPDNNHRVVDAGALGVAGLTLKNATMINKAINTILDYFYGQNPHDGGSYEGYSYNAYGMFQMLQFAVGLKRINGYNFFEDAQFLASLKFMGETLGPLGMPALFEDCTFSSQIQEVLLIAASHVNNHKLAQNFQYLWEQRQNNSLLSSASEYGYLRGSSASFQRILCYNVNETITPQPYEMRKEVWKESSMAFFRCLEHEYAPFLSFSCKDYSQSHTHYDENSFEIWAYGAYVVNNPGYPGFGKKHHDWTMETEASNTLLIGGSGQRRDIAGGLISSISSPYFSMVMGQADEIYNDMGAFEYMPELIVLLLTNFVLLGVAALLFLNISKKNNIEEVKLKKNDENEEKKDLSTMKLLKMTFINPYKLQTYLSIHDPFKDKSYSIKKNLTLFISFLGVLLYITIIMNSLSTLNYHAQYYEDKVAWVFELLPIIQASLLLAGALIAFLIIYAFIKLYYKMNRFYTYSSLDDIRTDLTAKTIDSISSISLVPLIPVILFGFILLNVSFTERLKEGISRAFTELGSLNEIYNEILTIQHHLLSDIIILLVFSIPFMILSLSLFNYGLKNNISQVALKKHWKIPLLSIIVLLIVLGLLFSFFIISMKGIFSLISIENTVQG